MQIGNVPDLKRDGLWIKSYTSNGVQYHTRAGILWKAINTRCRAIGNNNVYLHSKNLFSDFQEFAEWCNAEYGYMNKESNGKFWCIDKDVLVPNNRDYSPETCCFIPQKINAFFADVSSKRGEYPIGVCRHKKKDKITAQICVNKKVKFLGYFENPMDAHREWQLEKIRQFKKLIIDFDFLPEKVLTGLKAHCNILITDYENRQETVRGNKNVH